MTNTNETYPHKKSTYAALLAIVILMSSCGKGDLSDAVNLASRIDFQGECKSFYEGSYQNPVDMIRGIRFSCSKVMETKAGKQRQEFLIGNNSLKFSDGNDRGWFPGGSASLFPQAFVLVYQNASGDNLLVKKVSSEKTGTDAEIRLGSTDIGFIEYSEEEIIKLSATKTLLLYYVPGGFGGETMLQRYTLET